MITRFLINRRDKAAHTWVTELLHGKETQQTHRRLTLWDTLLDRWTNNGTRRTRSAFPSEPPPEHEETIHTRLP